MSEDAKVTLALLGSLAATFAIAVPSFIWSDHVVGPLLRGTQWASIGAFGMVGLCIGAVWFWHWSFVTIKGYLDGR